MNLYGIIATKIENAKMPKIHDYLIIFTNTIDPSIEITKLLINQLTRSPMGTLNIRYVGNIKVTKEAATRISA